MTLDELLLNSSESMVHDYPPMYVRKDAPMVWRLLSIADDDWCWMTMVGDHKRFQVEISQLSVFDGDVCVCGDAECDWHMT